MESIVGLEGASIVRQRRTTQEIVLQLLRDAILTDRLRGGTRLIQEKVAQSLGVSRIPVREALLQLESEGLIRMEAHRGASVVWLSPKDIAELFELRALLVSTAVRLVAPLLTDEQIGRLQQIVERLDRGGTRRALARANHAFYETLYESLGRPRLSALIGKLEQEVQRYYPPLDGPHPSHSELVQAFRERDAERAAKLVGLHIEEVGQRAAEHAEKLLVQKRGSQSMGDGSWSR